MAQAPQNPYQGVQGVRSAWANLARWVTVTLPDQWAQLQEIIDYVNGATVPTGGGGGGSTGPSLGAQTWALADYSLYAIGSDDYAATFHAQGWRLTWNNGGTVQIGGAGSWDGSPNFDTDTAVAFSYDVMISGAGVTVWPDGTGFQHVPDGILWEPGRAVIW